MKGVANRTKNDAFWLIAMQQNFLNITDVKFKNVTVTVNNKKVNETRIYIKECSLFFFI